MSRLSLFQTAGKVVLPAALLLGTSSLHGQSSPAGAPPDARRPTDVGSNLGAAYQFRTDPPVAEPAGGTVGVRDLAVPPKALEEFDRSMKAFQAGNVQAAAGHLEKAIKIAPDFARAHNNLGAMYINLRNYKRAMAELHKTIDLDPKLESPYHNLAMLMIFLGRLPEAEAAARQALELDTGNASHYWLGRILVMEGKNSPEAEQLLTHAAAQIPAAMLWMAQLLQNRGEISAAMTELQGYLQVCDAGKRDQVKSWLAQLAKVAANQNAARGEHQGT
jgi:Flp pilus assembly protein TadD